jgi:hypothetical protein
LDRLFSPRSICLKQTRAKARDYSCEATKRELLTGNLAAVFLWWGDFAPPGIPAVIAIGEFGAGGKFLNCPEVEIINRSITVLL